MGWFDRSCVALVLANGSVAGADATSAEGPSAGELSTDELATMRLEDLLDVPLVTASGGVEEEKSFAAGSVTVVTRAEINRRGWRSLTEILAQVPGLYVINDGVAPALAVRGTAGGLRGGTRVVRLMINGNQVNFRPDLSAFLGPEFIPIEAVERVEIVRGPLSALYGANAFLATVNVLTRDVEGAASEAGLRSYVTGSVNSYGGSALMTMANKYVTVLAAAAIDQIDRSGLKMQQTFDNQQMIVESSGLGALFTDKSRNDFTRPLSTFLQVAVKPSRFGTFKLEGGLQQLSSDGEFQLASILTHQSFLSMTNAWSKGRYELDLTKEVSLAAALGYSRGSVKRDTVLFLTGNANASFRPNLGYRAIDGSVEASYNPSKQLSLRLGADVELDRERVLFFTQVFEVPTGTREVGESVDLIGVDDPRIHRITTAGVSLHAASAPITKLPNLKLSADGRLDRIRHADVVFPTQLSWRAAAAYRWSPSLTTKLIGGRAFQTPSGVMMTGHPGFGVAGNIQGNLTLADQPVLRPQVVTSLEAAVSAKAAGLLGIEGSVYLQDLDDKIEFVQRGGNFNAANRGSTRSFGGELTLRLIVPRVQGYLSSSAQVVVNGSSFDTTPPSQFPVVQAVVGADVDVPEWYLGLNAQARIVGSRGASQSNAFVNNNEFYTLPAYTVFDASIVSTNLRPFSDSETRVFVTGRNVLDKRYSEPGFAGFDVPVSGRMVMLGVTQLY
jgi:outer membrane receptor protein involved in Fe transport